LGVGGQLREDLIRQGLNADALEASYHAAHTIPLVLDAPLDLTDPVAQTDNHRILDASANRAREAIRVLEDFVRFSLNDAFLSRQLKQLRHDLAEVLADLPTT